MAGYWSDKFFGTIWDHIRLVNDTDPTIINYVHMAFKWKDTIFLGKQRIHVITVAPEYSLSYPDQLFVTCIFCKCLSRIMLVHNCTRIIVAFNSYYNTHPFKYLTGLFLNYYLIKLHVSDKLNATKLTSRKCWVLAVEYDSLLFLLIQDYQLFGWRMKAKNKNENK